MDTSDLILRNQTYSLFVKLGRAPSIVETARALGWTADRVAAGWRRLHEGHALVLQDTLDEIRMANPFSAVPTAHRVQADGRWWYGNCAWDAFGILAALGVDGRIESSCPDCGEPISLTMTSGEVNDPSLLFHCLVPASSWWEDIVFT
jgi:hypothetical protein